MKEDSDLLSPAGQTHFLQSQIVHGMTLRDYFAAAALQDAARICSSRMNAAPASALAGYIAQYAYEIADAMIAEREK